MTDQNKPVPKAAPTVVSAVTAAPAAPAVVQKAAIPAKPTVVAVTNAAPVRTAVLQKPAAVPSAKPAAAPAAKAAPAVVAKKAPVVKAASSVKKPVAKPTAKKVAAPKAKSVPAKAAPAKSVKTKAVPAKPALAKPTAKPVTQKTVSPTPKKVGAFLSNPVEKATQTMTKGFTEITDATKANTEAVVKASTTLFKLVEDLNRSLLAYTQAAVEKHIAVSKEFLGVKTLPELIEKQSAYAKTSFDALIAEATKLSELTVKVSNEAFAPINARVTQTVERIAKKAA